MLRTDLVATLEICKAALSDNALVPIMNCFWFRGDVVMAYNDKIAISVPLETDFKCAVPGLELLALLKASHGKDAELSYKDGDLTIKMGNTRAHIEAMPESTFVFDMPKAGKPLLTGLDGKAVTTAVETCLLSLSYDNSIPDQTGVTLMVDGGDLLFFGTNHQSLSHAWLKLKADTKPKLERAILNGEFAARLVSLVPKGEFKLEISDKHSLYHAPGDVVLFGKLVETRNPMPWFKILDAQYPEGSEKNLVPIPTKMELILDRATIAAESSDKAAFMEIEIKGGKAKFTTSAPRMEVHDTVELDKAQPDCQLRVNPKLVKTGYKGFDQMLFTERALILANKHALYFVSNSE